MLSSDDYFDVVSFGRVFLFPLFPSSLTATHWALAIFSAGSAIVSAITWFFTPLLMFFWRNVADPMRYTSSGHFLIGFSSSALARTVDWAPNRRFQIRLLRLNDFPWVSCRKTHQGAGIAVLAPTAELLCETSSLFGLAYVVTVIALIHFKGG